MVASQLPAVASQLPVVASQQPVVASQWAECSVEPKMSETGHLGVHFPLEMRTLRKHETVLGDSKVQTKYFRTAAKEEEFRCLVTFKSEFRL